LPIQSEDQLEDESDEVFLDQNHGDMITTVAQVEPRQRSTTPNGNGDKPIFRGNFRTSSSSTSNKATNGSSSNSPRSSTSSANGNSRGSTPSLPSSRSNGSPKPSSPFPGDINTEVLTQAREWWKFLDEVRTSVAPPPPGAVIAPGPVNGNGQGQNGTRLGQTQCFRCMGFGHHSKECSTPPLVPKKDKENEQNDQGNAEDPESQ
jgi:hypothetical protein